MESKRGRSWWERGTPTHNRHLSPSLCHHGGTPPAVVRDLTAAMRVVQVCMMGMHQPLDAAQGLQALRDEMLGAPLRRKASAARHSHAAAAAVRCNDPV
jgi:hypothetical protein